MPWNYSLALFCIWTFPHNSQVAVKVHQNDKWQIFILRQRTTDTYIKTSVTPHWGFCISLPSNHVFAALVGPRRPCPSALYRPWNVAQYFGSLTYEVVVLVYFWNSPTRMGTKNPKYIPVYLWQLVLGMQS